MKPDVALKLVQAIARALLQAENDKLRIDALEWALANQNKATHDAYQSRLETLQRLQDNAPMLRQIALDELVKVLSD